MAFVWPAGFPRIPEEDWARRPIETLALKYDTVESHGWYRNLDRTVEQLGETLADDDVVLDYSGGTGILADRLLRDVPGGKFGVLIVDSSPKFLRLALDKLCHQRRVAFRLIRFLKEEKRLQLLQEVIDPPLLERGVDAVVSTNAIHLYYGLQETLQSWAKILRPGRRAFVQSGNILNPDAGADHWIIDNTVEAIHKAAKKIVRSDARFEAYREILEDVPRMKKYRKLRRKFFLPVRPLDYYLEELRKAGFDVTDVSYQPITAEVNEWYEFLAAYHEGVLGWLGGSARVEGKEPTADALRDRLSLIREAMNRVFKNGETFEAGWTYITCRNSP